MLKRAARTVLHSLGAIHCFRSLHRRGLRILMYHHFRSDTNLRAQCEHIRRFYHPVTLDEVAAAEALPANAVAITVDDGYRNFLTNGYPVFREFKIPVTMYLVSDFIDRKIWLWWDVIDYLLGNQDVCERLKRIPNNERLRNIDAIVGESELPSCPPEKCAPLTWDEIRELARDGVTFGAHTKTHPILSRIADGQELQEEIATSKRRIEEELEHQVTHFCYPNGRYEDFTAATVDAVAAAGFQTAVTAEPGINFPGAPPFLLNRLGVEPDMPMPYFSELLAGVRTQ